MDMKKLAAVIGLSLGLSVVSPTARAALNEWTFEQDPAGTTLSQAVNLGTEGAVFSGGGSGFLQTDGLGALLSTHAGTNGGAVLDAEVTDLSSGVQYLRFDFNYDLRSLNHSGPMVLGLTFADSSGTNVAGVCLTGDWDNSGVFNGGSLTPLCTNMMGKAALSVIVGVDIGAQTMSVWYDLTGSNQFDQNSPAVSNSPVSLASIDKLRFQATGDFRPAGSTDYAAVQNIRTASTWDEIAASYEIPFFVHSLFQDNMVLQRDMNVPVWGRATPGSVVTVKLDGATVGTAVADLNGRWLAKLEPHANDGGTAHILTISSPGETDIQLGEVVFGDVYIASGQSNMEYLMSGRFPDELTAAASYPLIRHVVINTTNSVTQWDDPLYTLPWTKCSTAAVRRFSATAYFFAKYVHLGTGVPVGLLSCAWGGQRIERFLSPSGADAVPELAGLKQNQEQGGITYLYDIYNAMIAPLVPYGVHGAIWYQGEYNSGEGDIYRCKMQALMRGWRQEWAQGDFPFYYVQLPNYDSSGWEWPGIRNAQFKALSETNTGMAVTIDVGEDLNLHPTNKFDIGRRLAQWALAKQYQHDIVYSGPLYRGAIHEESQIRVLFDYADNGLVTGWKTSTNPVVQTEGPLQNFEVAGADKVFVSANAVIDKDTVVVSSPSVSNPVYVRYCWANAPSGTNKLYNATALPASPFNTAETYNLEVISGSGTAVGIPAGTVISIAANTPASGKVFDRWIGAASEISNPNASSATVTMPAHSLYLLAAYRDSAAPVYTLTVNNGSGDGASQAGSVLNIEAASMSGQRFDHWSGDTQTVVNVRASSTTLRMPTNNVTVTAVYRAVDSAGDGITDDWRATYFGGNGSTTNSQSAAGADPDGDGRTNLQEFLSGTSPVDAQSVFELGGKFSGSGATLQFLGSSGQRYRLEKTDKLLPADWIPLFYSITGEGKQKTFQFDTGSSSNGFYRLRLNSN